MPYYYSPEPTDADRERIQDLFSRMLRECYPDCRFVTEASGDEVLLETKFFCELDVEEDPGRIAALRGGLNTDHESLVLYCDLRKWKASPFARNLAMLVHEVSHLRDQEHGWRFWLEFKQNFEQLEEKWSRICGDKEAPDLGKIRRECVHHVTECTSDLEEDWWVTRQGLADALEYPMDLYDTFEFWSEPANDESLLSEERRALEEQRSLEEPTQDVTKASYIDTNPIRGQQVTNLEVSPKYIERPDVDPDRMIAHIASIVESGCPPIWPPIVEPTKQGPFRIIEGEIEVAVAQRTGLLRMLAVNCAREVVEISDLDSAATESRADSEVDHPPR